MNPNQPQQGQPQQSMSHLDYLNQIAPQAPKKQLLRPGPRLFIIAGAALIVIVIILSIVIGAITTSQRKPLQELAVRLETTSTIADKAQSSLKSSQLRSLNSSLSLYLAGINRDVDKPLLSAGVNTAKIDASITKAETAEADAITARLENARLNVAYDNTYAREMAHQLETLMILMKQIYSSTNNTELQSFLTDAYSNLEPTQKALADFNANS